MFLFLIECHTPLIPIQKSKYIDKVTRICDNEVGWNRRKRQMTKQTGNEKAYDTKTLSELLGLSTASVRKLGKEGKIGYSMCGAKMFFDAASVKRYLEG